MHQHAFEILGIEPTTDGRVIRNAFVRLARIYHPDRFMGMAADVRAEAERRMKEAVAAYEELRAMKKTAAAPRFTSRTSKTKKDPWEEVRRARDAVMTRRLEQERSRARWMLWEELERQARERATYEAQQASIWIADDDGAVRLPEPDESAEHVPSALARRLADARNGSPDFLAPRR
ncbi:MAG: J domain-containing protein [Actinomycetota bacterium]